MNEFNLDDLERDIEERNNQLKEDEKQGIQDIVKYFDRMHDKLLSVNNIFIAAYLALIAFKKDVPHNLLWVPMLNMGLLIYIDWRLMESSRRMANKGSMTLELANIHSRKGDHTNLLSLLSLVSTIVETILFIKYVS
ncbi:hypothetical protein [Mucilaginibacter sp. SJ]|uniref:hypothetical protein n=1 Tax=Mucilaginibacter sp. SJ TaxID=3029053 RepID=UPI0023A9B649|nr:hypothetical protein [Mucilaginibacter sp. SJ]WEA00828.1 hypothetical protein MusilaSJ_25575 [Mucilaginibacter sp. SJ]